MIDISDKFKVGEGAYFIVDEFSFSTGLIPYNPILANQAINFDWEDDEIDKEPSA